MGNNRGFKGTTITIGGTTYQMYGISLMVDGKPVDVTDDLQASRIFEVDLPDWELTVKIRGSSTPTDGSKSAVVLQWKDSNANAALPGHFILTSRETGGETGQSIDSTVKLKPCIADT